ncbi:MAG: insulinase family protein, partial [Planctomycetes bacterium]|nr:insulinase family protein [Planctomycetota bacterium]
MNTASKSARASRARSAAAPAPLVQERRLENGLRVLVAERHADPVVAVMLWYRVGSRNEREHEAGVSHFLEHMMFKGAERFGKGEIDRLTTMLGGS